MIVLIFGLLRLDQCCRYPPVHSLTHFDQEQLLAGVFALTGTLGVDEDYLFHC